MKAIAELDVKLEDHDDMSSSEIPSSVSSDGSSERVSIAKTTVHGS